MNAGDDAFARAEALHDELAFAECEAEVAIRRTVELLKIVRDRQRALVDAEAKLSAAIATTQAARASLERAVEWASIVGELAGERVDVLRAARVAVYGAPALAPERIARVIPIRRAS